jgi:stage III sporulation protein AA
MNWIETLRRHLPPQICAALAGIDPTVLTDIEEIRMRASRPLMVYTCQNGICVDAGGALSKTQGIMITPEDISQTFDAITGKSPYAFADEISQGFLTLESGIRAGIAGSSVLTEGGAKPYKVITGINFRIPTQAIGISNSLLPYIAQNGRLINTLVLSAPGLGKTTLVRDIARCAGSGIGIAPVRVTLIDERQELAASEFGQPLFDVGMQTDVISGVVKHTAVFMALRALSPTVIVTDEIGMSHDLDALREVANSGVVMITTAHAPSLECLLKRLFFRRIFEERLFDAYVVLSASLGRITVSQIHDGMGQEQLVKPFLLSRQGAS